ncbi:helix-turn-helix domain-containing protein [Kribbella deserti]|uniref:Helix-turn-helix domain-containing protein n=1 Tax=Kribbella deserti TaxID=1926257 RepID=A0ABV6QQB3_9ACTN
MADESFGALLHRFRTGAGLTQAELGDLSGLSVQTISTLERGTRSSPRRPTVLAISEALRLSPDAHERLLAAAQPVKQPWPSSDPIGSDASFALVPRMLPPSVADFTGRQTEVEQLRKLLATPQLAPGAPKSAVIAGMGGVGKTSLALHVAHLLAESYPDGQLFIDRSSGGRADG